jgi:hypothetical protein
LAGSAKAQTVAEAARLPEAQQREIVLRYANNSIANLPLRADAAGKPKSDELYTRDRILANLVRALFIQDAKHADIAPDGLRVMLVRIKKYSTESPNRTVLDVMGDVVDWSFQHFYIDYYTPEKKANYVKKSDAEQEAWFRIAIQLYEDKRTNERIIAELKAKDAEVVKSIKDMYDSAVILADGRHVLRSKDGDFMVVSSDPDDRNDVKLERRFYPEAQSIYDCMRARGIHDGQAGRAACAR